MKMQVKKISPIIPVSLFAILLLSSTVACGSASEVQSIPKDSLIVDVRTAREFQSWHFPGAINIPVSVLSNNMAKLGDKARNIIVYCRSGSRSSVAKRLLLDAGFTNVLNGGGLRDMAPLAEKKY